MGTSEVRTQVGILFTAFEPSGDAHAAPVIAELKRRQPNLQIYAWGGPKMEAAGATLLGRTADDGSMGVSSLKKVLAVRKEQRRIRQWSKEYRVLAHVAVDSPAANFPICKMMKDRGARVVHLVAPQLWAWGRWRLGKLKRCTDLVLCLLPFEESWFGERGVPAKFIGHPVMNSHHSEAALKAIDIQAKQLPSGTPKVAIFPGSRSHEVRANIRMLVDAYTELQGRHHGMGGVIVAANQELAKLIRKKIRVFPGGLHMVTGQVDAAIAWCDLALAVSGTVTLDVTRQLKPMVGVYKTGVISWLGSKLLLKTAYKLLPNIVAEREIVPEFVPHVGGAMPIVRAATPMLIDSKNAAMVTEALRRVALRFSNKKPAEEAATLILELIGMKATQAAGSSAAPNPAKPAMSATKAKATEQRTQK
ncbi:MAG TPA: hypothetical protein VG711_13025 [Phycisphaerales bacterium]|nr:hypothetical protein [Phycisphaerales bacterium]